MGEAADHNAPTEPDRGGGAARVALTGGLARGESIGRFVLLDLLGEGGMGIVYAAYDPQLDRKVAIKLLHPTVRSEEARVRLLREAQAMARINHPNVVKVHEAGTFREQVYVAMEFCDGGTVRGWLEAGSHKEAAILDVFLHAGRGLAAVHDAGLVHRDFKPHNVLLSSDGVVRVTDFGIASLVDDAVPDPTTPTTQFGSHLTRTGAVIGTPLYMAPEQFAARPATARSDQFSFCVALYEALYGELPFRHETVGDLADAVQRGAISPAPTGARVAKWLRKVVVRGLSVAEVDRHPSMSDLLSALARDPRRRTRHIIAIAAVAIATVATISLVRRSSPDFDCGGGAGRRAEIWNPDRRGAMARSFLASGRPYASSVLTNTASKIDDWAAAWEGGYRDACEATRVHGEQSEHLLDLRMQCLSRRLQGADATITLLATANGDAVDHAVQAASALPELATCSDATVLLADVAPPELGVASRVAAVRMQSDRAKALRQLGRFRDGLAVDRAAVAEARAIGYGPATAEAMMSLGVTQYQLSEPASADTLDDALHAALSAGATTTAFNAAAWRIIALVAQSKNLDAAWELAEITDALAKHTPPPPDIAVRLDEAIGALATQRNKFDEAQIRYERALARAAKFGPEYPVADEILDHMAHLARTRGKFAEAEQLAQRVVTAWERRFGPEHPHLADGLESLAEVYRQEGKYTDARRVDERALTIRTAALGPDDPAVGESLSSIGSDDTELGDTARARTELERAVEILQRRFGPDGPQLGAPLNNLGGVLKAAGELDGAAAAFEHALRIFEKTNGPDDPSVAAELSNVASIAMNRHDDVGAQALLERALRIAVKNFGPDHPDVVDYTINLAITHKHLHDLKGAAALYEKALTTGERAYGVDHPRIATLLINYGQLQLQEHDGPAALASFRRGSAIIEAKLGPKHVLASYTLCGEAMTLMMVHRAAEAIPLFQRALAIRVAHGDGSLIAETELQLAEGLVAAGDRARGVAQARAAVADYKKVGNATGLSEAQAWLAKH